MLIKEDYTKVIDLKVDAIVEENNWYPEFATPGSACFDIRCIEGGLVGAIPKIFKTGLYFEIPKGFVLLVFSRSGHGFVSDIRLSNCVGVIDSDYRGELKIKLTADGVNIKRFEPGERIAQGLIIKKEDICFNIVETLSETERGEGGFGSTGK